MLLLNRKSALKRTHTTGLSYLIIIIFVISALVMIDTNTNTTTNPKIPPLDTSSVSKYLNTLVKNAPSTVTKSTSDLKNVIIKYNSLQEKQAILQYVNTYGSLVDVLVYMPYILAKIPMNQYSMLINHNVNVIKDKLYQVIPKSTASIQSSIPVNASYKPPVDQINASYLVNTKDLNGKGINIAVIDSGIDFTHPDLVGKNATIYSQKSFVTISNGYSANEGVTDLNGHGTHVAGLAAGTGAASGGKYVGVAPGANLFNLKVVDQSGSATESAILEAIDYALNPAFHINIITMSLGFQGGNPNDPVSLSLDNAVNNHGIVVTVAAGNAGPGIGTVSTPGDAQAVITVGASYWQNDTATYFSSRGPTSDYRYDPDILAPGWFEVSTLASGSLLEQSELYYNPTQIISYSKGNYIPESGTSMATPVVAGSVALLLQAFPHASPQTIRAALMETAVNNQQPEYVQGAGFINVTAAYQLLQKENAGSNTHVNVISLLPQRSIFPNNPVLFPGDQLNVNLQFVAGTQTNIGIQFGNQTFANLITYNHSDTSLEAMKSNGYYGELMLNFTVPMNPVPGYYNGSLVVTTGLKTYNLTIGPIYIEIPSKKIAWNVWYSTNSADNPNGNYADLATYLNTQNITFDIINQPINQSWIYQYKTIVLPDNELSISRAGISLLKDYINSGGNVIIISSFYPFSDISNYNNLTQGYGISLLNTVGMKIYDLGTVQIPVNENESMSLSNFQNFNQITGLQWFGGTHLQVDPILGGKVIGSIQDSSSTPVMAAFTGNNTSTGKLFVFSSEFWFYNGFFETPEQKFSQAFFNYIVNQSNPFIDIINPNQEIQLGDSWNASIFVGPSQGVFDNPAHATITVTSPNSSIQTLIPITEKGAFGGNITFKPNMPGQYNVTISYKKTQISTFFSVYNQVISYNVMLIPSAVSLNIPSFLQDVGIPIIDKNNQMSIMFTANTTLPTGFKIDAVITLVPEILSQYSGLIQTQNALYSKEITLTHYNSTAVSYIFDTSQVNNVGFYFIDLEFSQGNSSFIGDNVGYFFVTETLPTIDSQASSINNNGFSAYDISSQNPSVLTVNPGQTISISIQAKTLQGNGSAFVLFVPLYPFIESQEMIDLWQINSTTNGLFVGNFTLPNQTTMPSYGRTLNFAYPYYTALLVVLRDQNGNYNLFPIITLEKTSSSSLNSNETLVFFIFVIIPGIIVFIYYMKSRSKRKQDYYNYNYNVNQPNQPNRNMYPGQQQPQQSYPNQSNPFKPQEEINFCPYCGASLLSGSNFCMECGKKIK